MQSFFSLSSLPCPLITIFVSFIARSLFVQKLISLHSSHQNIRFFKCFVELFAFHFALISFRNVGCFCCSSSHQLLEKMLVKTFFRLGKANSLKEE